MSGDALAAVVVTLLALPFIVWWLKRLPTTDGDTGGVDTGCDGGDCGGGE